MHRQHTSTNLPTLSYLPTNVAVVCYLRAAHGTPLLTAGALAAISPDASRGCATATGGCRPGAAQRGAAAVQRDLAVLQGVTGRPIMRRRCRSPADVATAAGAASTAPRTWHPAAASAMAGDGPVRWGHCVRECVGGGAKHAQRHASSM